MMASEPDRIVPNSLAAPFQSTPLLPAVCIFHLTRREDRPLTSTQRSSYEEYTQRGEGACQQTSRRYQSRRLCPDDSSHQQANWLQYCSRPTLLLHRRHHFFVLVSRAGRSLVTDALLDANTFPHTVRYPRRTLHRMSGSLTLEEVAGSMSRPLSVGTMSGHLAACLEAGLTFEWDRRRLGIDAVLEGKVGKADSRPKKTNVLCVSI